MTAAALWLLLANPEDLRQKFLALTEGWTRGVVFTPAEQQAMDRGRQQEKLMWEGLDDPLARRILAAGEPSFEALAAAYPGKILDRAVLGAFGENEEFVVWWNGAVSANLRPAAAYITNLLFRVGAEAEMFGLDGNRYSRIAYQEGFLPIVTASYTHGGVRYQQTVFAAEGRTLHARFEMTNLSQAARLAELHAEVLLLDGGPTRLSGQAVVDRAGRVVAAYSEVVQAFAPAGPQQRLSFRFPLGPGGKAAVYFRIPYSPGPSPPASEAGFTEAHRRVRGFWLDLLARGANLEVPDERLQNVWRALLIQNFILADGPRFTYGAGLQYNDSYYPVENGHGAHTFALYGHTGYANSLLPYSAPVSVKPELAARKYQNRRGLPLAHLFENYRLSKKTDVFERHREDLYRVAEEIIAERRGNMREEGGRRPLHWGWLPPDRPGVDLRASTQTVYVPAHNITSCQALADFGRFLMRTGIDPERGRRYLEEAGEYRRTILGALERSAIRMPGRPPFVDLQTLYFRETPDYGPEPYDHLGTGRLQGTYYHYWADMQYRLNFFNPSDEVGQWIADYVAARGGFVLGSTWARHRPEQPYGWINNVYNAGYYNYRLRSGRREEFLLGFYARLAFGMTRHAWVASEGSPFIGYNTRHGGFAGAGLSFPNSAANAETLLMLRNMLILEELKDNQETGDIHLLSGIPSAWLEPGERLRVERAPTYFGEMSFSVEAAAEVIRVRIDPPVRDRYRTLVLALPQSTKALIRRVRVNGVEHRDFDAAQGLIRLPQGPARFQVEAWRATM